MATKKKPEAEPLSRDEWVNAFCNAVLVKLRPDAGSKYCETVAVSLRPRHGAEDPGEVARRWAAGEL